MVSPSCCWSRRRCALAFGAALGLGVDESYMVASGRVLSLGYYDHPPAAWWLSWGAAHLFGSEAPIVVRLPFIALFALSTWLMYRLGDRDRRCACRAVGGGAAEPVAGIRRDHGHLGAARRAVGLCAARARRFAWSAHWSAERWRGGWAPGLARGWRCCRSIRRP